MKILKNTLLLSFVILFLSCTGEGDSIIDRNAQADDLIGTWNLIEESQDGTVATIVASLPVNAIIKSQGKNIDAQIVFSLNPANFSASGGYTDVINISAVGQTLVEREVAIPLSDFISQGTWLVKEGVLTFTQNNVTQDVNITELTATSLKIELEIEDQDVTYQDFTGTVNTTIKMSFEKQ